ncbi:hypothetical protein BAY59_24205 [Prauserella coralliicola]|nr:hypothetical protein BAY59_24205 [Prauserella coralliicola]
MLTGGEDTQGGEAFAVAGTFTLTDGVTEYANAGDCVGYRGYDDIGPGAQVTVYDNAGAVLAAGQLGPGRLDEGTYSCVFDIRIEGVPSGHNIYQIEVSHRGKIAFSEGEPVALTLG